MKNSIRIILASATGLALILAIVAVVMFSETDVDASQAPANSARAVRVEQVQSVGARAARSYPGEVQAAQNIDVSFRVGGPLVGLSARDGVEVTRGTLLARIDPRDFRVNLRSAEAQLASARAQLEAAHLEYGRVQQLYEYDDVSKAELDQARAALLTAEATVATAEESRRAAELALEDTKLEAAVAGKVSEVLVENHQIVQPGQVVLRLQDLNQTEVRFDAPESELAELLTPGACRYEVSFVAMPGQVLPASLSEHAAEADPVTRTYSVTLTMPRPDGAAILPGMTARVRCVPGDSAALATAVRVPSEALSEGEDGRAHVFVIDEAGARVERRVVSLGELREDGVEVTSGLVPGERIVTAGAAFLSDGESVRVRDIGRR